nr:unnamed protein product [Digitaria exilis]
MSGRLKHRPVSSSRSARSTQSTEKGINGLPSANQQQPCAKKRTRSRTDSGERLKEEDKPTIKAVGEHWEVHPYQGSRKPPTVIGALVREMYPDVVDTAKGPKPVLTWEDYKQTSTCGEPNDKRVVKEFWELKTGVDPGLGGAWLHNHELHPGTKDGCLCSQSATDKWAQYEEAMVNKYGPNWKAEHPNFDASVIFEYVGRMSHGKLGIADEAISIAEKESIKTRKRSAQPYASAREKRLERENEKLRKDNRVLSEIERVVRAMAAKGGLDYDALAQETTTNLAASGSEGGLSKENEKYAGDDDYIGGTYNVDEDDVDYNYDNAGYHDHEYEENCDNDADNVYRNDPGYDHW